MKSGRRRKTFHSTRNIDGFGRQKHEKVHFSAKSREFHKNLTFCKKYQYFVNIHDFSGISYFFAFWIRKSSIFHWFYKLLAACAFPMPEKCFMCENHNFTFFITRGVDFSWNSEFSMFGTVCILDFLPVAAGTAVVTPPLRRPVVIFEILWNYLPKRWQWGWISWKSWFL